MNANGKHYEWHLFDGQQWSSICNDHVIETHYCQPGARGMTIDTHLGSLYIDFDAMTIRGPSTGLCIRRQTFLSHNQTQNVGWYFKDSRHWLEYGTQVRGGRYLSITEHHEKLSAEKLRPLLVFANQVSWNISPVRNSSLFLPQGKSSVNSQILERWYNTNPTGSFQFTVGRSAYIIDFSAMTQTRRSTQMSRKVRRRPQFKSFSTVNDSSFTNTLSASSSPFINSSVEVSWEFMGDEGIWTKYQKPGSSLDSVDIESQYQLNPQGQLSFTAGRFNYTLDFRGMCQINNMYGTRRQVRRSAGGDQHDSSAFSQIQWQYKDENGCWKDFVKGSARGSCTVSSQDIETHYQQNSTGTMSFRTGRFNYQLDFSAMIQTNMSTYTQRAVRRL